MADLEVRAGGIPEEDRNNWNTAVKQSGEGDFFHTYEWLKLIEKGLSLEPYHIIVKKNNSIIGGFPNFVNKPEKVPFKRLSSIPVGMGGFFIVTEKEKVLKLLIDKFRERKDIMSHRIHTAGSKYIQYSRWLSNFNYKLNLNTCKFIIDITKPFNTILNNMSRYKRRDIRKIDDSPIEVEEAGITDKNLELFYSLYQETMKRVQGNTKPPLFFRVLADRNYQGLCKLFFAKYKDKTIAAFLHFLDKSNSVIYEFFAGAKDEFFKYKPNDLLRKHSILWAQENNFNKYDMGGTSANFNDGIFKFKNRWGGQVLPYLTWEKPMSKWRWYSYRLGRKIYKKWICRKK